MAQEETLFTILRDTLRAFGIGNQQFFNELRTAIAEDKLDASSTILSQHNPPSTRTTRTTPIRNPVPRKLIYRCPKTEQHASRILRRPRHRLPSLHRQTNRPPRNPATSPTRLPSRKTARPRSSTPIPRTLRHRRKRPRSVLPKARLTTRT